MGYTNPSGTVVYNIGDHVMIQAISNPGFRFVRWEETGSAEDSYEFDVTGNATYTAEFEPVESNYYVVRTSCDPANMGSTSGDGTYLHGTSCTIDVTPDSEYDFVSWNIDGVSIVDNPYTFTVEHDTECIAVLNKKPSGGGVWNISVSGNTVYASNGESQVSLNEYCTMQDNTLYVDVYHDLTELGDNGFVISYTNKDLNEVTIEGDGIYPDFNTTDQYIDSIINVSGIINGDTTNAIYVITILQQEQRSNVTARYLNGDENWWNLNE